AAMTLFLLCGSALGAAAAIWLSSVGESASLPVAGGRRATCLVGVGAERERGIARLHDGDLKLFATRHCDDDPFGARMNSSVFEVLDSIDTALTVERIGQEFA